uniref:Uncharacterized protein n=1 Tax=viral metagenome TaxID=1070528 RepID=A0A6C0BNE6_9ZZZZ
MSTPLDYRTVPPEDFKQVTTQRPDLYEYELKKITQWTGDFDVMLLRGRRGHMRIYPRCNVTWEHPDQTYYTCRFDLKVTGVLQGWELIGFQDDDVVAVHVVIGGNVIWRGQRHEIFPLAAPIFRAVYHNAYLIVFSSSPIPADVRVNVNVDWEELQSYHDWSAEFEQHGRPNQLVIRLGLGVTKRVYSPEVQTKGYIPKSISMVAQDEEDINLTGRELLLKYPQVFLEKKSNQEKNKGMKEEFETKTTQQIFTLI